MLGSDRKEKSWGSQSVGERALFMTGRSCDVMCFHKNKKTRLYKLRRLPVVFSFFVDMSGLYFSFKKSMFSSENGSLGVTWVEDLKEIRLKRYVSALKRNMNLSVFSLPYLCRRRSLFCLWLFILTWRENRRETTSDIWLYFQC